MSSEGKLVVRNEKNEEKEFSILATFDIEEKNKSYVLYTDYSRAGNGNLKVYASTYNKDNNDDVLGEVTEEDEKAIIDEYLKGLAEDLRAGIILV